MSICSFLARLATRAAAVAVFAWAGASASAADVAPPPAPPVIGGAGPVYVGDTGPGCATCQHGAAAGSCSSCKNKCDKVLRHKGPYQVNLCPGACFGYFQTQWRKWDEVCPYPYLGTGVSDAPRPPAGVLNPRPGPGELSPPRPLDPKMPDPKKVGTLDLPTIPTVPGKFDR